MGGRHLRGRRLGYASHPELFFDPVWGRFWKLGPDGRGSGAEVPTEVVQVLVDILHHGREYYDTVIGIHRFMSVRIPPGTTPPTSTHWF